MPEPVRVVLAEDAVLLREGLAGLLTRFGFQPVAAVGDADALKAAVAAHRPGLVITDVRMPPSFTDEGLRAAVELRRADPGLAGTYAVMLAELAASGRERGLLLGYAWLPGATGPVAQIDVSLLRAARARTGLTVDMLEKQFGRPDPGTVEFEVSKVQLPAGPALRTRQVWQAGDSPSDTALSVTYACRPPEISDAVMYTMYWTIADDEPRLTEIADALAATLRITS